MMGEPVMYLSKACTTALIHLRRHLPPFVHYDMKGVVQVQQLQERKIAAVAAEDYGEAKKLKQSIDQ